MRFFSTLLSFQAQVDFNLLRKTKDEICLTCGERMDHPAGRKQAIAEAESKAESEVELEEEGAGSHLVVLPVHEAQARADDIPVITIERAADDGEDLPSRPATPPDVAVSMDIKVRARSLSIPIPVGSREEEEEEEERLEGAEARGGFETVEVESVGDIDSVHFNKIVLNRANIEAESQAPARDRSGSRRESQLDRVHQYVHRFDKYKPIMTMHYVDDKHVRHTESLFADDLPDDWDLTKQKPAARRAREGERESTLSRKASVVTDEDRVEEAECGAEEGGEGPHHIGAELHSLLEAKLMQPARVYETGYQREHQRRLKERQLTEVTRDTGRFSLQVFSFSSDLPSPSLSRSGSIHNVSADEGPNLVSSVADAATLAQSLQGDESAEAQ